MKKRAALARAIISDESVSGDVEEVVMYDEPTVCANPNLSPAHPRALLLLIGIWFFGR